MKTWRWLLAAGLIAAPAMAQEPAVPDAQESEATGAAALHAAAEAIDPLAHAAQSEAAWQAYLNALRAEGGSAVDEALALNLIGNARYYQQNFPGALETALEAIALLEAAQATENEAMAESLANAATFYGAVGERDRQLPMQERAMAIRQRLYGDDPAGLEPEAAKALGLGYLNYSSTLYDHGRFVEAAELVEPAIAGIVGGGLQDATLFVAMSSGANILSDGGRIVDALDLAQRGVATATRLLPEGHPFIGFAQATLGRILLEAGRVEEAEGPARRAFDIMTAGLGKAHPNTLTAMNNLAIISAELGDFEAALELMLAQSDVRSDSDPVSALIALSSASNFAAELGHTEQARSLAEQAAALAEDLPETDARAARALDVMALRLEEAGEYQAAAMQLDRMIARQIEQSPDGADADLKLRRGLQDVRLGKREAGLATVRSALDQLEERLVESAAQAELGGDLSSFYEAFMQAAEAGIAAGDPDLALRAFELASWGENARARQFLALRRQQADNAQLAAMVDAFRKGQARLRLLNREQAALLARDDDAGAEERAAQIAEETARVAEAREALSGAIPDFARWLRPETPDIAEIQSRLSGDEAILIAMPARHRTFVLAITRERVAMHEAKASRGEVRAKVQSLRRSLDAVAGSVPFDTQAAAFLYNAILPDQVHGILADKPRVAVVTSDALSRLPFGVLVPDAEQTDFRKMDWLMRRHAISVALSPSDAFRRHERGSIGNRFLGVGAPALSGAVTQTLDTAALFRGGRVDLEDIRALPALPATVGEIAAVSAVFGDPGNTTVLTGADATEPNVRSASAARPDVVLFATHGLLGGEVGGLREPALVLTPPEGMAEGDNDGLLRASEIAQLGFAARLVILSACNSAAGRAETSPAYTGLANAFLGSGSEALVLSHWRVRDDAAARLTVETIRGTIAGLDRAEALRQAQLKMIEDESFADGAHPAVWAPFIIIGD